ncbi:MAG: ribosome-associated translation inhibitor RaiA [Proteobacteria bacterium]|nr:ribosome-associated translation inhibitor RaiA [Pseudomonadota bacterium]
MDIRVSGHQIETGEALQSHAQDRVSAIVEKYFGEALSGTITFNRAPAGAFRCDIVAHVMQGLVLKGAGIAQDAHLALDQAAEKIDKQSRRYKRRIKDRHDQQAHAQRAEEAAYTVFVEPDETVEEVDAQAPVVIAETRVDVPEATVSDAVMMLDLRNTNALLFKNAGTGRHNMVYRRGDGSIGWVEPS